MKFRVEKIPEFLENFRLNKKLIENFEGCHFLELLESKEHTGTFFTHSHWESNEALQRYRNSDLFKEIWSKTKPLFIEKAQAWSTTRIN